VDKILVQTSKLGDILGVIPICYAAHLRGERYGIMASSEYSDVLEGCSYLDKISFIGKPWLIKEAVEEARKLCPSVVVTQINGPIESIKEFSYKPAGQETAKTDSFIREPWQLAGFMKEWGKVPLIFDRRDKERESEWIPKQVGRYKRKPVILLSAGSISSPFLYKDLLVEMVNLKYGKDFNVIDLAEIKAHRFYDLLGLYEMAHCLITVDTAHLHLAAAVPTLPVMALIQDRPLYWHGTAWRPQHHFYCRYRDFPRRALELFTAINKLSHCKDATNNIIHVYHGGVKEDNGVRNFAIQPGSCRRDSMNCLNDKEHFPMLQDVLRMTMQVAKPNDCIILTQTGTNFEHGVSDMSGKPCYAYRMNRDKNGNDRFFPATDMFAAPVDFWVKIFGEIPDVVLDNAPVWGRILQEIFKSHGAVEVEGIFRNE
jgi:hypothetical protein